ncbi:MAG: divalent-cation tolerance protein CutA [Betaproteobacteria bacterium]|nr:divalent-cation tolerance protein CutA [Betaproteobacteria bacterium]
MPESHEILLVLVTMPDRESGEQLAAALVENRLAACVNLLSPCYSVYRWQGKVERAEEIPLFIKTGRANYPALETFIRANHPYELPEIIALPLAEGLPPYLDWVKAMCNEEGNATGGGGENTSCV